MEQKSLEKLAQTMREKMTSSQAYLAENATLFMGKTIAQLRAGVTKAQVGLGKLQNLPMATLTAVQQGLATGYSSTTDVLTHANFRLKGFTGEAGDSFFLNDNGFSSFIPGKFYEQLAFVTTQAELDQMLNVTEKMADVYDSWKRISRGNWRATTAELTALGFTDSAVQGDLNGFSYNAATDTIRNPVDTVSFVGFICPNAYEDYVLDITLKADSTSQNDPLGVIVGYVQDADGTTHTLSVMRHFNPNYSGGVHAVCVFLDYNTIGGTLIAYQDEHLHWVDGTPATGPMNPPPPSAWAVKPWAQAPNGCRLRVTRAGDLFTVETTEYDSTVFVDAAKFTFSIANNPQLARFKGPQRYGYAAISQDNAIWNVNSRPGARQAIVDLRDRTIREWNGSAWVVNNSAWSQLIKPNRFYHNTTTNRLFYAENETTVIPVL